MTQLKIDQIIINNELTIREKVKQLIPLLMEIHQVLYGNAYQRAKKQVDPEWVLRENKRKTLAKKIKSENDSIYRASETKRKNAIIKHKCETNLEYREDKRAKARNYQRLIRLNQEIS